MSRRTLATLAMIVVGSQSFAIGQTRPDTQPAPTTAPSGAAPSGSATSASAAVRSKPMGDEFKIVLKRSMFSKDRSRPRDDGGRGPNGASPAPSPKQTTVFTGVLLTDDDQWAAFMENRQTNTGSLVHVGDTLVGGVVSEINLDSLSYLSNGKVTLVKIGQNLVGELVAPSTGAAVSSSDSSGASTSSSGSGDSIVEKLRLKRLEEQKKLGQ